MSGLTFRQLRTVSAMRQRAFKNAKGEVVAEQPGFVEWDLPRWFLADMGELGEVVEPLFLYLFTVRRFGEAANRVKKTERGDFSLEEARETLSGELADVVIYLDLLAAAAGIDLEAAVVETFNAKSEKLGLPHRLSDRGVLEAVLGPPESFTDEGRAYEESRKRFHEGEP